MMMGEFGLTNANLPKMELHNLLEVSPPPNRCELPYLNDPIKDPWWNSPQISSAKASESCLLPLQPTSSLSEYLNLLPKKSSDPTIQKR